MQLIILKLQYGEATLSARAYCVWGAKAYRQLRTGKLFSRHVPGREKPPA